MNNNKISSLQFSTLMIFPILSLFSGIGLYDIVKIANIDSYISPIISTLIGILILLIFIYILNYKKELSLPEKNIQLFGPIFGNIINYMINILILFVGIVIIYSISNFIVSQFLAETPIYIILILFGIIIIYSVTKGIEVIARTGIVFFIIIIILTIISTFGLIPFFDTSNIKPILENGIKPPIEGGMILTLTNIVPIIIMLIVPKNKIVKNEKLPKYLIIAFLISMLFIFLATLLTVDVLGIHLLKIFPHPEYIVLKKISILGFIDRIENIIYIKWLLNDFISLALVVYYISNSIKRKNKQKIIPIIVTIIILLFSQILFKDNTEFKWFVLNIYPYLNLLLLLILIIISINIIIKRRIEKEA